MCNVLSIRKSDKDDREKVGRIGQPYKLDSRLFKTSLYSEKDPFIVSSIPYLFSPYDI